MTSYSLTAAASHVVNLYFWDMLAEHMPDTWKKIQVPNEDGTTRRVIPIIPTQEQPEAQVSERPYIVYMYDIVSTSDLWQLQGETLVWRIFSQSPATIAATTKLATRLFNRFEETAYDINAWLHSETGFGKYYDESLDQYGYNDWMDDYRNFQFKTVSIAGVSGTQPSDSEGNRVDALVTIDLKFIEFKMEIANNNTKRTQAP